MGFKLREGACRRRVCARLPLIRGNAVASGQTGATHQVFGTGITRVRLPLAPRGDAGSAGSPGWSGVAGFFRSAAFIGADRGMPACPRRGHRSSGIPRPADPPAARSPERMETVGGAPPACLPSPLGAGRAIWMAGPAGLEPTTGGLENRCSIQLSYGPGFRGVQHSGCDTFR